MSYKLPLKITQKIGGGYNNILTCMKSCKARAKEDCLHLSLSHADDTCCGGCRLTKMRYLIAFSIF